MAKYKLIIEYDGSRYKGWQQQKNGRSIQEALIDAARAFFQESVVVQGSGRTDAGVHALGQVAHLEASKDVPPEQIQRELNDRLPFDIHILSVKRASQRFHARHDALGRSYLYQVSRRRTALAKRYVWWVKDDLHLANMKKTLPLLKGMHDFASFADKKIDAGKTQVLVEKVELVEAGDLILFRIRASHFVWKMVRRVMGMLVEVGRGNLKPQEVNRLLEAYSEEPALWTAPPSGLFLEQVLYPGDKWQEDLLPVTPLRSWR